MIMDVAKVKELMAARIEECVGPDADTDRRSLLDVGLMHRGLRALEQAERERDELRRKVGLVEGLCRIWEEDFDRHRRDKTADTDPALWQAADCGYDIRQVLKSDAPEAGTEEPDRSDIIRPVEGWEQMDEDALEEAYGDTAWWSVAKRLERHRPDEDEGNRAGYSMWLGCVGAVAFGYYMHADEHGWAGVGEQSRLFKTCAGYYVALPWMDGYVPV